MRIDGLGVILAIILLPVILIITYYIQLEVDTIAKENDYNTKLLDATYDAMSAFEINTANEELSSVADSMRSIILASNNVLFNTLAINLGLSNSSKEYLQPYVPAVLYTLYDGYYIYAPTEKPKVVREKEKIKDTTDDTIDEELTKIKEYKKYEGDSTIDGSDSAVYGDIIYEKKGGGETTNPENADVDADYVLKSYVQYSARYVNGTNDVTINYTLDNYLNIIGTINGVYYTKTGYLIKPDIVESCVAQSPNIISGQEDMLKYNEQRAEELILGKNATNNADTIPAATDAIVKLRVPDDENPDHYTYVEISTNWQTINDSLINLGYITDESNIKTISDAETYLNKALEEKSNSNVGDIANLTYEIQKYKAIAYYTSSKIFSDWVYKNLKDLKPSDIKDESMKSFYSPTDTTTNFKSKLNSNSNTELYYDFGDTNIQQNNESIFKESDNPEDTTSAFYTHKLEVIKNSIKYNLNMVISNYNEMGKTIKTINEYEASMPVLLDEEWDKILQNISIVTFMQGWDCGLDLYNNYELVSSTNNELTVTPEAIYYVPKDTFNDTLTDYHRIDCGFLPETPDYISFKSKEVKYDKIYDKNLADKQYKYDHRNFACYTCINSNNYEKENSLFKKPNATSYYGKINSLQNANMTDSDKNKIRAGYIGLANERQSIYKTNALPISEGYKIVSKEGASNLGKNANVGIDKVKLKDLKQIVITIANTKSIDSGISREAIMKLKIICNGVSIEKTVNLDQLMEQTITLDIPSNVDESECNSIGLIVETPNYDVKYDVKSVKAVYK